MTIERPTPAYYVCRVDIHCSGVIILSGPTKNAEGKTESNSVSSRNDSDQKRYLPLHTIHCLLDYYKLQLALCPPAQCKLQSASMCLQLYALYCTSVNEPVGMEITPPVPVAGDDHQVMCLC